MNTIRRRAREWAVQMLAAADLNPGEPPETIVEKFWEQLKTLDAEDGGVEGKLPRGRVRKFAEARVLGVLGSLPEIDAAIVKFLSESGWSIDRLGTVERAVLRVGIWELANTDTPIGIVMNEAIDICNWFSTPKSRSLVNGVLDRYAKSR
jgi:N utilization substance protein B